MSNIINIVTIFKTNSPFRNLLAFLFRWKRQCLFWILWQWKKFFWMFVILFMVCFSYVDVSKMLGQTSAMSSTYQNKEKFSY